MRLYLRWQDNIKTDVKEIGCKGGVLYEVAEGIFQ
jgi:hypothetical protein